MQTELKAKQSSPKDVAQKFTTDTERQTKLLKAKWQTGGTCDPLES